MTIARGQPIAADDINNLTFFPRGTILTFSSEAWNATSAAFKTIWKVCNGQNGTPDLVNKFLRGAESSGSAAGADSQSITLQTANLPSHSHGVTNLPVANLNTSGLSIASSGGHVHSGSGTTGASGGHTHTVSGSTSGTSKTLTGTFSGGENGVSATGIVSRSASSQYGSGNSDYDNDLLSIDATHTHSITGSTPAGGGTHAHDVSVSIPESGSHTHAVSGSITGGSVSGSTGNTGSGTAFTVNTIPGYYTVIYIMKVV